MSTRPLSLLLLLAAAACGQKLEATGCRSDAQCAADARCQSGVCAADARPVASLRPVAAVEAYALVQLDGSASHDADGRVTDHLWTVTALDAPCAPPEIAARDPLPRLRFGCPGRYEVALAVRDDLGVESAPARVEVEVLPATAPPVVAAGPDVATDHRCGGTPFTCRTADDVRLVAAAATPGVTLRWSVEPPAERPLDATRRVRFLPDATAAEPRVELETDGTAISGDWIFRVEALDAFGVVGASYTRVSVRNRAPVVTVVPAGPFPHAFDAARSLFTSSGALSFAVVDPDGDPLEVVQGVWRHLGDGADATFDGDFDGTTVTFTVEVPYAAPSDALRLRGGEGLQREIEIDALDANRAVGRAVGEVAIGNRPPVATGGSFDQVVPHRFDAARSRYVATVRAGTFADPDGDPLVDSAGPGLCGTIHVDGDEATVECSVPYEGVPALDQLAGTRSFPVAVRDPWDVATAVPVRTVQIQNAAPVLSGAPAPARRCVAVRTPWGWGGLGATTYAESAVTFDVQPRAIDPDGDPLLLVPVPVPGGNATPSGAVCTDPACVPFRFYEPGALGYAPSPTWTSFLDATDGAATSRLTVSPAWDLSPACVP